MGYLSFNMPSLLDALVLGFGGIFYALTALVFFLRAYEKTELELSLKIVFSVQFIPFCILLIVNLYLGQVRQAVTLLPMVTFLGYDYWYRVYTERKPVHHPDRWPRELVVYLVLLFAGSIGVNWYGYLVSELYGTMLVVSFFAMMGAYSLYQYRHNKGKQ